MPEEKAEEIADFAEFTIKQYEEQQLSKGLQQLTTNSKGFLFSNTEEVLYTEEDLKEEYNGEQ